MGTLVFNGTTRDPATALFGETKRRVLALILLHPEQSYFLRQIVRETGAGHGAVQRELETLTRAGLLVRRQEGRQVYFRANLASPFFGELQNLMRKSAGVDNVLRQALAPLAPKITAAFIFGSAARNALKPGSDIDLLVVGETDFADVANAVSEAQNQLGREVNPMVYPPAEFSGKLRARHHFLTALRKEPRLFLLGDDRELGRLAEEWLADATPVESGRNRRPEKGHRARSGRQRNRKPKP